MNPEYNADTLLKDAMEIDDAEEEEFDKGIWAQMTTVPTEKHQEQQGDHKCVLELIYCIGESYDYRTWFCREIVSLIVTS